VRNNAGRHKRNKEVVMGTRTTRTQQKKRRPSPLIEARDKGGWGMGDDVLGQEREKESEIREGRGGRVCATLEPHRFAKV
jgi:hypothetical protein